MSERFKSFIDFFNFVDGILNGTGSRFKALLLVSIAAIVALVIVVTTILEIIKRFKENYEGVERA